MSKNTIFESGMTDGSRSRRIIAAALESGGATTEVFRKIEEGAKAQQNKSITEALKGSALVVAAIGLSSVAASNPETMIAALSTAAVVVAGGVASFKLADAVRSSEASGELSQVIKRANDSLSIDHDDSESFSPR